MTVAATSSDDQRPSDPCRKVLRQLAERPPRSAQQSLELEALDDAYVRRGLVRRADVRRLRLVDGLPAELGGRRPSSATADAVRASVFATRQHLIELGLHSATTEAVLRELWAEAAAS